MKLFSLYEPRRNVLQSQDYKEVAEDIVLLEEAKAGFNPKDVPRLDTFTNNMTVPRIYRQIMQIRREKTAARGNDPLVQKLEEKERRLEIQQEAILTHYNYIVKLANDIADSDYAERFYANLDDIDQSIDQYNPNKHGFEARSNASDYINPRAYDNSTSPDYIRRLYKSKFEYEQLGGYRYRHSRQHVFNVAMSGLL